jgi:hypothetical protein
MQKLAIYVSWKNADARWSTIFPFFIYNDSGKTTEQDIDSISADQSPPQKVHSKKQRHYARVEYTMIW